MLARYPTVDTTLCHPTLSITFPSLSIPTPEPEDCWVPQDCASAPVLCQQDILNNHDKRHFLQRPVPFSSSDASSEAMDISPEDDLERITRCVNRLQLSGYYYEGLSWQQASMKLRKCQVGTFLVRDSENPNFLFTLSVQTKKGPTSIRIAYKYGKFRLDSDDSLVSQMPVFDCVTDVMDYYVSLSSDAPKQKDTSCVWLDLAGVYSAPVEVYKPLYKRVHRLEHLCRMSMVKVLKTSAPHVPVDRTVDRCNQKDLPSALKEYLKEYPHRH